jgi:hypothetical protein
MPRLFGLNVGGVTFLAFGLIFGLTGVAMLAGSCAARQQVDELAAAPLLSIEQLPALEAGQPVAVEGRISERNTAAHESLVVFVAREYGGVDCDDDGSCSAIWAEVERVSPAIWLDLPGGRLRLSNTDYDLLNAPETWYTDREPIEDQTLEYAGFRMGNPVFAAGTIDTGDGRTLRAEFLFGGSRADYLTAERDSADSLLLMGLIFGSFGFIFGAVGVAWLVLE